MQIEINRQISAEEYVTKTVNWPHSQLKDYNFAIMKLSGGLDSAMVLYMLCKYIREEQPDLSVVPMTHNDWVKPFQIKWAEKVLNWMRNEFPDVKILNHETSQMVHGDDYIQAQIRDKLAIIRRLEQEGTITYPTITIHGVNMAPPDEVTNQFLDWDGEVMRGPADRTGIQNEWKPEWQMFRPIINLDKKDLAELYKKFNLQDTLFELTRSCENPSAEITENFETHCEDPKLAINGECWFCKERKWGFGKI